jgi:cytochrome c-type biogenesis protein
LIIAFGVFLIAAFKLPWLNYEKRLNTTVGSNPGYLRSIGIGAAFALGWTPCIGPILGAILTLAWSSQTIGQGALLLTIYSLGLGIPFIILGLVWGAIMPWWKNINRHLGTISIVSGVLLIIVGILILTGNLAWLGQFVPS